MEDELLKLTRSILDMKTEKKLYIKDINERIKAMEDRIKVIVRDDTLTLPLGTKVTFPEID